MTTTLVRPSRDEWALGVAAAVALMADCSKSRVGAVALDEFHQIISANYNGPIAGDPGCLTEGACPRATSGVTPGSSYDTGPGACVALHAEQNLIRIADWKRLIGATLYVTREPCDGCWKMIRGAMFRRVVWPEGELIW